jgi:hypothetical protein
MAATAASIMTAAASILLLVLLETMTVPAIASPEEEAAALLAFKRASVGDDDPLGALAGWARNSTGAPCSWAGVSCEPPADGRVVAVNLSGLTLAGELHLAALQRGAAWAPGSEERKRGEWGSAHRARP